MKKTNMLSLPIAAFLLLGFRPHSARGDEQIHQDAASLHQAQQQLGQDDSAVSGDARARADAQGRVRSDDDRIAQDIQNGDLDAARKDEAQRTSDLKAASADAASLRQAEQKAGQQSQVVHHDEHELRKDVHQEEAPEHRGESNVPPRHNELNAQERMDQMQRERDMERHKVKADDAQIAKDVQDGNVTAAKKEEAKRAQDVHAEHVDEHMVRKDKQDLGQAKLEREKKRAAERAAMKAAQPPKKAAPATVPAASSH